MDKTSVDVIVIGGGISGICAAIAAAKNQASVALIESKEAIGGNAIHSNVGTICGAYYYAEENDFKAIQHPFLLQFLEGMKAKPFDYHQGLVVIPYQIKSLSNYLYDLLEIHGVTLYSNCEVNHVQLSEDQITSIECNWKGEALCLEGKAFVDCSGRAVISDLAGLEMLKSEQYQMASQVFRIKDIHSENEFSVNFAIQKAITTQSKKVRHVSLIPGSLQNGQADLKLTLPVTITDETDREALNQTGRKLSIDTFDLLKRKVPSIHSAELDFIYPEAGIRIQQRSKGKYVLTKKDVLEGKKWAEERKIIGTWPIEDWKDAKRVSLSFIANHDYYEIPLDCLQSTNCKNLFFGGKNISATDEAIASARVIGTCIQSGYEAGRLAARI
ncbi:FAD-dependent oxidoreductase [Reichenbachiella ulvae]|uniref:FAD-dependent oxidoreductase n=1 Tax=Reichenbachiella ulvae TaxID=2980104 RepID=A0ABT3CWB6_9BACT|nr:FAD-dependent oxidoreductase [Reichenbachiella ulvae]MCV9387829.1 FAD-dependent oxidoreductase [Reichenbachiella ulvae]